MALRGGDGTHKLGKGAVIGGGHPWAMDSGWQCSFVGACCG